MAAGGEESTWAKGDARPMDDGLVIDCDGCPMQDSTACDDCVVGVMLSWTERDGERASRWGSPKIVRWPARQERLWH